MWMIRRLLNVAVLVALLLPKLHAQKAAKPGTASGDSPFAPFAQFSATLTSGLLKDEPRKVYRSGKFFRVDLDGTYHVTDLALGTTWSIRPERCTRVSGPDIRSYPFAAYRDYKVERFPNEDKETVDGHPCKIENVTFTQKESGLKTKMKVWRAEDLQGFPVKIELFHPARTMTISYTNVSLDKPDAALFKLPAKCTDFQKGEAKGSKKSGKPSNTPPKKLEP
jgi:hypothetical protein